MDKDSGKAPSRSGRSTRRSRTVSQPATPSRDQFSQAAPSSSRNQFSRAVATSHDQFNHPNTLSAEEAALLFQGAPLPPISQPENSLENSDSFPHFLRALQGAYPVLKSFAGPTQQSYPPQYSQQYSDQPGPSHLPPPNVPWPQIPSSPPSFGASFDPAILAYIYGTTSHFPFPPLDPASSTQIPTSPSVSSPAESVSSHDPEQTEAERAALAEDKRRRNTAASARFRIKKKQRTLNLERSVSDLSGRATDLEREVSDLRRENNWLKEIIMMKGRGLAGMTRDSPAAEGSGGSRGRSREAERSPEAGEEEEEEEDERREEEEADTGECKEQMMMYMDCLSQNSSTSSPCRDLSKSYLDCRMNKGLMERDDWKNLGLTNTEKKTSQDPKPGST